MDVPDDVQTLTESDLISFDSDHGDGAQEDMLGRGDGVTAAGQTEVARCAAVLDDEHQGEDQNRSYKHAAHAVDIGI